MMEVKDDWKTWNRFHYAREAGSATWRHDPGCVPVKRFRQLPERSAFCGLPASGPGYIMSCLSGLRLSWPLHHRDGPAPWSGWLKYSLKSGISQVNWAGNGNGCPAVYTVLPDCRLEKDRFHFWTDRSPGDIFQSPVKSFPYLCNFHFSSAPEENPDWFQSPP